MKLPASLLLALCACTLPAQTPAPNKTADWVGSWATAQQLPEPANSLAAEDLNHATLRQIVHLSLGGDRVRIHLSNAFGAQPLHLAAVHVAHPISPASPVIDPATDRLVTFNHQSELTVPAGSEYISDPIDLHAAPLSDLAVTIQYDAPPSSETGHPGSHATSYLAADALPSAPDLPNAKRFDHWYQLSGVDVLAPAQSVTPSAAIVTLGDSITDGHGATTNGNDRWPDLLAARLQTNPATRNLAVLNEGIGGNRLLLDGLGPNALARFDRDALAQPGARFVILLEGVNDLGTATRLAEIAPAEHDALVARILGAYSQLIERAHAHNLRIFGATITPYTGSDYYHPGPLSEADRQKINAWIRSPKSAASREAHFDGLVDFDRAIADPAHPDHILPAFDSGDHLHPSPAGYKAMAATVPPNLFTAVP